MLNLFDNRKTNLRGILPFLAVALLGTQDAVVQFFGELCKPIVIGVLNAFGFSARDYGLVIQVEHLEVPWTGDCSGVNLLLLLLAVYAWMNRRNIQDSVYWLRMLAMIPAAVFANVLRVISLIAYRYVLYPEVESPQTHYFLGFLWLIPFALLALPRKSVSSFKELCLELLHVSAVLGMLTPLLVLEMHALTAFGVVVCLANSTYSPGVSSKAAVPLLIWVAASFAIVWVGIGSLWLPWLLLCPLYMNMNWVIKPKGFVCLLMACPAFILIPYAGFISFAAVIALALSYIFTDNKTEVVDRDRPPDSWSVPIVGFVSVFMFMPFALPGIIFEKTTQLELPESVEKCEIEGRGFQVMLPGQPHELGLLWYDPVGNDRHHTVDICLGYRGVNLEHTEVGSVKTDGSFWYKEYFMVNNKLIETHRDYLFQTLGFRSDLGVHIILIAKKESFSLEDFSEQASLTAERLHALVQI